MKTLEKEISNEDHHNNESNTSNEGCYQATATSNF